MSLEDLSPEEIAKIKRLIDSSSSEKADEEEKAPKTEPPQVEVPASGKRKRRRPNRIVLGLISVVAVAGLAILYGTVIEPWMDLNQAKNEIKNQVAATAVFGANTEMLAFTPEKTDVLAGANPNQLALGTKGVITTPPYFEFKSSNSNSNSHIVDLYIDFYSQRSRDLISLNQTTLSSFIGDGTIILRVHPVLQTDGFSVYAPEALAEVFGTNPKLAWNFFVKMMQESDQILSSNTTDAEAATTQQVIDFIAGISKDVGIPTGSPDGVDSSSLKYLTFFSWLYSGTRAPQLDVGYYPPILYIGNKIVDQDKWPLSDSESFLKLLSTLK